MFDGQLKTRFVSVAGVVLTVEMLSGCSVHYTHQDNYVSTPTEDIQYIDQGSSDTCSEKGDIPDILKFGERHHERVNFIGEDENGNVVALLLNPDNGSWSFTSINDDGSGCLYNSGTKGHRDEQVPDLPKSTDPVLKYNSAHHGLGSGPLFERIFS